MFDLLVPLLSKTVDVLLKKGDLMREAHGPVRFYELYQSVRRILDNAMEIRRELIDCQTEARHIPHVAHAVETQAKEPDKCARLLRILKYYMSIYDRDLASEIGDIWGKSF